MVNPLVQAFGAGPFLMLQCMSYILFGILVAQMYYYWLMYKDDNVFLRRYIWGICILAICHSSFSLALVYDYYVTDFGDPVSGMFRIDWEARACMIIQIAFVMMTQALYVSRIWKLSNKSVMVTSIPAFLLLCRGACGIANSVFICLTDSWAAFADERRSRISVNITFVVSVLTDIVTSTMLVYYLFIRRTRVPTTTDIVHKLMLYVVNTGAITIVFSLAVLLLFNFSRNNLIFGSVYLMLGKLYANTMLAMLNARRIVLRPVKNFNSIQLSGRRTETHVQIYQETVLDVDESGGTLTHGVDSDLSPLDLKADEVAKAEVYSIA